MIRKSNCGGLHQLRCCRHPSNFMKRVMSLIFFSHIPILLFTLCVYSEGALKALFQFHLSFQDQFKCYLHWAQFDHPNRSHLFYLQMLLAFSVYMTLISYHIISPILYLTTYELTFLHWTEIWRWAGLDIFESQNVNSKLFVTMYLLLKVLQKCSSLNPSVSFSRKINLTVTCIFNHICMGNFFSFKFQILFPW